MAHLQVGGVLGGLLRRVQNHLYQLYVCLNPNVPYPSKQIMFNSFWTFFLVVALIVAYLAALTRFYTGDGFSNLMCILYANLCMMLALHHAMVHLATRRQEPQGYRARGVIGLGLRNAEVAGAKKLSNLCDCPLVSELIDS